MRALLACVIVPVLVAATSIAGPRRKPLPSDLPVSEPVVRLCTCTMMKCPACNTCWCHNADGGVEVVSR